MLLWKTATLLGLEIELRIVTWNVPFRPYKVNKVIRPIGLIRSINLMTFNHQK